MSRSADPSSSAVRGLLKSAPTLRFYIRGGLGEIPSVAVEVLCVVLTLAVVVIRRLRQDSGAGLSRSLAVTRHVLDAYLHGDRVVGSDVALGNGEAALPGTHLD